MFKLSHRRQRAAAMATTAPLDADSNALFDGVIMLLMVESRAAVLYVGRFLDL
jgi:uncharacterized membrane protein